MMQVKHKANVHKETEKAVLVTLVFARVDGKERYVKTWIPKSCCVFEENDIVGIKPWMVAKKMEEHFVDPATHHFVCVA
ncbi:MAG: hypothetical protein QXS54_03885 [Candidatus Methanomethylicaceae archaeon]